MEDEMKGNLGLDALGVPGHIRFSIKADDTEGNRLVHTAFMEFCKNETDNNYTQGIRKLLEYYQNDFKYESIWNELMLLKEEIEKLKENKDKKEKKIEEMF